MRFGVWGFVFRFISINGTRRRVSSEWSGMDVDGHDREVRVEWCGEPGPPASPHIAPPLCHPSLELRIAEDLEPKERVTVTPSCVAPPGKTCFRIYFVLGRVFVWCAIRRKRWATCSVWHIDSGHGGPKRRFQALLFQFHPGEKKHTHATVRLPIRIRSVPSLPRLVERINLLVPYRDPLIAAIADSGI